MHHRDLLVIGGGIVGLATAYQFTQRRPTSTVTVLEKEPAVALHQTGRNSGVLHSGIYYRPGSLKATNCLAGKHAMEQFCREEGVPFETCGKVIVAVDPTELPALDAIRVRGEQNGVACRVIGREQLAELEPHAAGVRALHVPSTGIVDYGQVAERLAKRIREAGGQVVLDAEVTHIEQRDGQVVVESSSGEYSGRALVNCAGLYSDRVARMTGAAPRARIVPFRGEYYKLRPEAKYLVRNLIYPVPDPAFPFLGVHFTRMIDGSVECGPNAVLAFAKEGYQKRHINPRELLGSVTYPGFVKLAMKYWRTGAGEMWRSVSKQAFVQALERLAPEITADALDPAPAGVRAQAVMRDGTLVDDFLIDQHGRAVNVINAPSPAATASLNIGLLVVNRIEEVLR